MILICSRNVNPVNPAVAGRIQDPEEKNPAIPCLDVNFLLKTLLTPLIKTRLTDRNIVFTSLIRSRRLGIGEIDNLVSSTAFISSYLVLIRCEPIISIIVITFK